MPGCGKSTLARSLCEAGVAAMADIDSLVEARARRTIPAIMRFEGEAAFRSLEARVLADVAAEPPCAALPLVVSTGGGAPCVQANMDTMLRSGTVVWLRAGRDRSLERLAAAPGSRPAADRAMAAGRLAEWFDALLLERTPHYSRAHACFDSTELDTPEGIAATVRRFTDTFLTPTPSTH